MQQIHIHTLLDSEAGTHVRTHRHNVSSLQNNLITCSTSRDRLCEWTKCSRIWVKTIQAKQRTVKKKTSKRTIWALCFGFYDTFRLFLFHTPSHWRIIIKIIHPMTCALVLAIFAANVTVTVFLLCSSSLFVSFFSKCFWFRPNLAAVNSSSVPNGLKRNSCGCGGIGRSGLVWVCVWVVVKIDKSPIKFVCCILVFFMTTNYGFFPLLCLPLLNLFHFSLVLLFTFVAKMNAFIRSSFSHSLSHFGLPFLCVSLVMKS